MGRQAYVRMEAEALGAPPSLRRHGRWFIKTRMGSNSNELPFSNCQWCCNHQEYVIQCTDVKVLEQAICDGGECIAIHCHRGSVCGCVHTKDQTGTIFVAPSCCLSLKDYIYYILKMRFGLDSTDDLDAIWFALNAIELLGRHVAKQKS